MGRTVAQRVRFITLFISKPSTAKQREITKNFRDLRREIPSANYLSFQFELDATPILYADIKIQHSKRRETRPAISEIVNKQ